MDLHSSLHPVYHSFHTVLLHIWVKLGTCPPFRVKRQFSRLVRSSHQNLSPTPCDDIMNGWPLIESARMPDDIEKFWLFEKRVLLNVFCDDIILYSQMQHLSFNCQFTQNSVCYQNVYNYCSYDPPNWEKYKINSLNHAAPNYKILRHNTQTTLLGTWSVHAHNVNHMSM